MFSEASIRGADRIQAILDDYDRGSGVKVNKAKSALFFSTNCSEDMKREMHDGLDIPMEALGEKYLGFQDQKFDAGME